ncbi:NAD(P)/FAD-dependent oxidoreductase [Sphingobacterium alkalisoli]|uniref:NAD(P)/FAD-dependent oxidoreductase n=1 Tax=Sphingobacterium alkalisoli TaxID=1874115 RepID=A0A4U0H8P9_9SPHI|nr:NAD(P)/FAD-dependent oxidoreductase [Sphingobacterium alkalisoli]TJY68245.1 NAD(P)/FAD-dependent oxidoreductase [Sphingobacterium alkalisoli]GGH07929.1 dehydrogenase/oxidoreductase [Sphingobacterium alkalisoli]
MSTGDVDILIIGAGPSGCVAAGYLQKQGAKIKVVEKTKFPRLVVGESLIPRVMDHFDEAGLFDDLNTQNFQPKPGARFIKGNIISIFDFSKKFGGGWDWTWQIPRADFDQIMTNSLMKRGVDIAFETTVTDITFQGTNSITTVVDKEGNSSQIKAKFVIDSSGYGRVLPRLLNLDKPSQLHPHSAIFSHVNDVKRPKGIEGTQISFDVLDTEVWLWVIPFSNGNTSLGIVANTDFIDKLSTNGHTEEALRKAIQLSDFYVQRFANTTFLFDPVHLKNYSAAVTKMYGEGFALTGNSSEFLDPVFSSGVCFATESGILAAKLAWKQINGENVNWEQDFAAYMQRGIDVFTTYVKEWYTGNLQTLFFHRPENQDVKEKICAVLAGYVWNEENPFVKKHDRVIRSMAYLLQNNPAAFKEVIGE